MTEIPIKEFCDKYSQNRAAEIMGCTQGAISQMIKCGREIYITSDGDKVVGWYEVKRGIANPAA